MSMGQRVSWWVNKHFFISQSNVPHRHLWRWWDGWTPRSRRAHGDWRKPDFRLKNDSTKTGGKVDEYENKSLYRLWSMKKTHGFFANWTVSTDQPILLPWYWHNVLYNWLKQRSYVPRLILHLGGEWEAMSSWNILEIGPKFNKLNGTTKLWLFFTSGPFFLHSCGFHPASFYRLCMDPFPHSQCLMIQMEWVFHPGPAGLSRTTKDCSHRHWNARVSWVQLRSQGGWPPTKCNSKIWEDKKWRTSWTPINFRTYRLGMPQQYATNTLERTHY